MTQAHKQTGQAEASSNGTGHDNSGPVDPVDFRAAKGILRFARGHRNSKKTDREIQKLDDWGDLLQSLKDTAIAQRRDWPAQWLTFQANRHLAAERIAVMRLAFMAAEFEGGLEEDEPGADEEEAKAEKPERFLLNILGATAFNRTVFKMEWLVRHILVADQPGIVAAPKKSMKTSTIVDLGLSIASGDAFLGQFEVPTALPVLLLSGESGGFVIQDTMRRVCQAKGLDPEILEGRFFVGFTLPQLSCREHLDEIARVIVENQIKVILIDPLYLCLISSAGNGRRIDPANLFDMGPLFSAIAKTCLDAGATPLLVHHFRKYGAGMQFEEPELEDMAYAGIQEFARQWILLGRRKKFEPGSGIHEMWLKVGGSAGHSGVWALDIREGSMGADFKGRYWEPSVRPVDEARSAEKTSDKAETFIKEQQRLRTKEEIKRIKLETDIRAALAKLKTLGKATQTHWRDAMNWNGARMGPVVVALAEQGCIRSTEIEVQAGRAPARPVAAWEAVSDLPDQPKKDANDAPLFTEEVDPDEPY